MNPLLNRYFYKLTTLEVLATPRVEAESLVASSGIEPESGASSRNESGLYYPRPTGVCRAGIVRRG